MRLGNYMPVQEKIIEVLSLILSQKYKVNIELKGEKK